MRSALLWGVVGVLLVGGCGSERDTVDPDEVVTTPSSSIAPPPQLPERPRSLTVGGVDPCALLPEAERPGLEIDRPPLPTDPGDDEPVFMAPLCSFSVNAWGNYGVVVSDKYSIRDFLDGAKRDRDDIKIESIGGFPAAVLEPTDLDGICFIVVDVADDSSLYVVVNDMRDDPESLATVCDAPIKATVVALNTLEALQQ